jgi:hypothetical protein
MKSDKKQITISIILSWFFGVLFLAAGIGYITDGNFLPGIILLIGSAVLLPPIVNIIEEKYQFNLSGGVKVIIAFSLIFLSSMLVVKSDKNNKSEELGMNEAPSAHQQTIQSKTNTEKPTTNKKEKASTTGRRVTPISTLSMQDIINSVKNKTDLQKENYFNSKKGLRVIWEGRVLDADSETLGRSCYITIKPENVGLMDSVRLENINCNSASKVSKGDVVRGDGKIRGIVDILGIHVYITTENLTIMKR